MASKKITGKRPPTTISSVRVPHAVLRRASLAAKQLKIKRNVFIVAAMVEKSDAVLGLAA